MSIFGSIMEKVFGAAPAAAATTDAPAADAASTDAPAAMPEVDVEAVLTKMEEAKGEHLNWRESIVDLLKLLDLDSSLSARKQLAEELNVHVAADGTAEENEALHAAVMAKFAENGGKVPASLHG